MKAIIATRSTRIVGEKIEMISSTGAHGKLFWPFLSKLGGYLTPVKGITAHSVKLHGK